MSDEYSLKTHPVYDEYPLQTEARVEDARRDGHVVEEAEAHRLIGLRVVARRPDYREPAVDKRRYSDGGRWTGDTVARSSGHSPVPELAARRAHGQVQQRAGRQARGGRRVRVAEGGVGVHAQPAARQAHEAHGAALGARLAARRARAPRPRRHVRLRVHGLQLLQRGLARARALRARRQPRLAQPRPHRLQPPAVLRVRGRVGAARAPAHAHGQPARRLHSRGSHGRGGVVTRA